MEPTQPTQLDATNGKRDSRRESDGAAKQGSPFRRPSGRGASVRERVKPEFDQKIINLRRVTRVVAGGKRFNFSVALIAGNRKGMVGVGTGKAGDTSLAIEKAMRNAKKHMVTLSLTKTGSIPHTIEAKYSSATIHLRPSPGRGLVAGSAVRSILELGGVKDVNGKILSSSKNKLNIARATIAALTSLS